MNSARRRSRSGYGSAPGGGDRAVDRRVIRTDSCNGETLRYPTACACARAKPQPEGSLCFCQPRHHAKIVQPDRLPRIYGHAVLAIRRSFHGKVRLWVRVLPLMRWNLDRLDFSPDRRDRMRALRQFVTPGAVDFRPPINRGRHHERTRTAGGFRERDA